MSEITNKLEKLADLIKKRELEINNLRSGLSTAQIEHKAVNLPFKFSEELYALYQWRNGIERDWSMCFPCEEIAIVSPPKSGDLGGV